MSTRVLLYSCGLLLAASAHAAPPAPPPPAEKVATTDQIYASFESADYPKAMRQIAAALALKGDAALQYDRHELLALKAEVLVRLKNFPEAAQAFDEAAQATVVESKAAVDRCTAELMRRAKSGLYTPRAAKVGEAPAPIDVTDPANRPAAFAAMFEESVPKVEAAVKATKSATGLPPVLRAYSMVRDLRMLEQAGIGADAKAMELGAALTTKATALMTRAVADMSAELAWMQDPAQQASTVTEDGEVLYHVDFIGKFERIANDGERVARLASDLLLNFPGDQADALQKLADDAAALAARARSPGGGAPVIFVPAEPTAPQPTGTVGPTGRRKGGTNSVQRPNLAGRGAGTAGNRGVDTGGRR